MWISVLSAYLFASTISAVLTKSIVSHLPFSLIDSTIPGVTATIAESKHYDLVEFLLAVILFGSFLSLSYFVTRKKNKINEIAVTGYEYFYLAASIILYIQSHFVAYSGKSVLLLIVLLHIVYVVAKRFNKTIRLEVTAARGINGFLAGFVLFLIAKLFTTSLALPLLIGISVLFLYLASSYKKLATHPAHLLLILSVIFPTNTLFLAVLLFATFVLSLITDPGQALKEKILNILYPAVVIFFVTYQPFYYAGNLDPVEEGIWLGWLQSMRSGKEIYRDFVAYQPPLLPWGLNAFISMTGESIRNIRLYFHLLEILGYTLIYFSLGKLLTSRLALFTSMLTIFALTATDVRNNVEIRVGVALFALFLFYSFLESKNIKKLFAAGVTSAISFLVSFEVGIASLLTISICLLLFSDKKGHVLKNYVTGVLIGLAPALLYLVAKGSLKAFITQISFYGSAFSKGYFNIAMAQPIQTSFFRWHLVWQYFANDPFYYALSRFVLFGALSLLVIPLLKKKGFTVWPDWKAMKPSHMYAFALSLFGILLMRSVLGRSDYHHLLFVIILSVPLLLFLVQTFAKEKRTYLLIISLLLLFVFTGKRLQEVFLTERFFTLTTYGESVEKYKTYDSERSNILVGVEVNKEELDELLSEIETRTANEDTIFVFPWNPEIYFLADRVNATSYDIPYSFWTKEDQNKMIAELDSAQPRLVVYNPGKGFGGMSVDTLPLVNQYILDNYSEEKQIYSFRLLTRTH